MDANSTRVQDELRRSRARDSAMAVASGDETWQHGSMLPGVSPLAGTSTSGRGNGPVRAQAMRNAQSTYGNAALRRSTGSSASMPVQRVTTPWLPMDDPAQRLRRLIGGHRGNPAPAFGQGMGAHRGMQPAAPVPAPAPAPADVTTFAYTTEPAEAEEPATSAVSSAYANLDEPFAAPELDAPSIAPTTSAYAGRGETFGSDVGPGPVAASGRGNYAYSTGASFDKPTSSVAPSIAPSVAPSTALPSAPSIAPATAPSAAPGIADFGGWVKHAGKWSQDASYTAAPTTPNVSADGAPGYKLKSLLDDYEDEDIASHGYTTADNVTIKTKYMNEQERKPYEVSVGEGGRLYQGSSLLETDVANARTGMRSAGSAGGHLYAMNPQGQMYSADMASEWEKGGMQGSAATVKKVKRGDESTYVAKDRSAASAEANTFHHSSFLSGGDVAGAGEMKVHEGVLSMISNASGHYMPGPEYVMQTLNQLEAGGAPTDQARVRLMGDLTGQGYDASKEVTAAVGEFKQAGGSRDQLLKRHRVLGELSREFGVGVADSGPMKGIQMEPPDSEDIVTAQKDVFASLGTKHPFAKTFRDTKRAEGEVEHPAHYGDFMKKATGRDIRPKPKKRFSLSSAVNSAEPSMALPSAPSIAPSRQGYKAYGAQDEEEPALAPTPKPTSYIAYGAQEESEAAPGPGFSYSTEEAHEVEAPDSLSAVGFAYTTDTSADDKALPEGYVSQEEAEAQAKL